MVFEDADIDKGGPCFDFIRCHKLLFRRMLEALEYCWHCSFYARNLKPLALLESSTLWCFIPTGLAHELGILSSSPAQAGKFRLEAYTV